MLKDKDPRFRNLEAKIGVLVAVAVLGMLVALALIGREKDLFTRKITVYFVASSGMGLTEGMPVKLSGFKIGRVKEMVLTEEARVKVTLEINSRYAKMLKEGSRARLSKEGFMGDPVIELKAGVEGRPLLEGGLMPFERAGGVDDLVEEARPILVEVREALRYANDPEGDIKAMLANLKELSSELRETRRSLDDALNKKGGPVLDAALRAVNNVESLSTRVNPVMGSMETAAGRIEAASEKLPGAVEKMDRALDDIRLLTGTLAKETPKMREIILNADEALKDGRAVVKGVRESWPVRLTMPPAKAPELVPLDSASEGQ